MGPFKTQACWIVSANGLLTLAMLAGCRTSADVRPRSTEPRERPLSTSSDGVLLDGVLPQAAPASSARAAERLQLAKTLAAEPGWNLFETEHYFLATPIADPLLVEGAKRRLEAMRASLEEDFPDSEPQTTHTCLLRLLSSRAEFVEWGGQARSSAFWTPSTHTLVCYDAGSPAARREETWPALQHVLVHEYFGEVLGIDPMPPWLLYGLAAAYESLRFEYSPSGGRWTPADTAVLDRELRQEVAAGVSVSLSRLIAFDSREFHGVNEFGSSAYSNLILAASFVRFVRAPEGPPTGLPEDFIEHYCRELRAGQTAPEALRGALQGASLEPVERAWRAWIEARTGRSARASE